MRGTVGQWTRDGTANRLSSTFRFVRELRIPQRLKPAFLLLGGGTAESRALPRPFMRPILMRYYRLTGGDRRPAAYCFTSPTPTTFVEVRNFL